MPQRNHIHYEISSKKSAVAGDQKSWFLHYKWGVEGEVFVPAETRYAKAKPGDLIWFSVDGVLLGCAILLRVVDDVFNQKQELWFRGNMVQPYPKKKRLKGTWGSYIPRRQGEKWASETIGALKEALDGWTPDPEQVVMEKKDSLIQVAPSTMEVQLLRELQESKELGLAVLKVNGEDRAVVVALHEDGDNKTAAILAFLFKPTDVVLDKSGEAITPDSPEPARPVN